MARMSSHNGQTLNNHSQSLSTELRKILLETARSSIEYGLAHQRPISVNSDDYPSTIREPGASFVTLKSSGMLRGCIGTLEAHRPLVMDVACNAFAAAFQDPRFAALTLVEFHALKYQISVLGAPILMQFDTEADLVRQLRPHIDGLIIEEDGNRGTFLPSVWESLPAPHEFLRQLKIKAGLDRDYWSNTLRIYRYTTETFSEF